MDFILKEKIQKKSLSLIKKMFYPGRHDFLLFSKIFIKDL